MKLDRFCIRNNFSKDNAAKARMVLFRAMTFQENLSAGITTIDLDCEQETKAEYTLSSILIIQKQQMIFFMLVKLPIDKILFELQLPAPIYERHELHGCAEHARRWQKYEHCREQASLAKLTTACCSIGMTDNIGIPDSLPPRRR